LNFKNIRVLYLTVGIAVILRLLYVERPAFWFDEAFLILMARRISFNSPLPLLPFAEELFADHPPLFIWILSPFVKAFGPNEFFLRLPSVFFGTCTVIVIYFFGRLLANQFVGNLSSLLLALLPFHIVYSQQATNYSAFLFFFVFSLYLFYRSILKSERRILYASAAMTTLALFTHYLAILIYPIQFASLILSDKKKMIYNRHVWVSWIIGIIPFFFWIFFAPQSLRHLTRTPPLAKTPLVYYFTVIDDLFSYPLALMTLFYCISFKKPWKMTFQQGLIISWLVVSFSFLFFGLQIYDERYAFPVIPPILLSGALFLSKINSSVKIDTKIEFREEKALFKPFLVALLIVSVILGTSPNYVYLARNQMWWMKANWRDASRYLLVNYREGDAIYSTSFIPVRLYTNLRVEPLKEEVELITNLQIKSGRIWFLIDIVEEELLDNRFLNFLTEKCSLKHIAPNRTVKVYLFQKL